MRRTATLALLGLATALACKTGKNLASRMVDTPGATDTELTRDQAKCSVAASASRPLVVGWGSADRVSLEARLRRGLVAVRYAGCEMEVLRHCELAGRYAYVGTTRKLDRLRIRSADELYANLPTTAVALEAKLAKAGELNVSMALVGMYEADQVHHARDELEGACEGATHVIAGVQVGAFEFFAGADAEVGARVDAARVAGVGARSTATRELLNQDGDAAACGTSSPQDDAPPANCGALVRLELVPVQAARCSPGTNARDGECVASVARDCEAGLRFEPGRGCVPDRVEDTAGDRKAASEHPDRRVCSDYCNRGLSCEAHRAGQPVPQGKAIDKLIRGCVSMCEPFVTDFNRASLVHCLDLAECDEFMACARPEAASDTSTRWW